MLIGGQQSLQPEEGVIGRVIIGALLLGQEGELNLQVIGEGRRLLRILKGHDDCQTVAVHRLADQIPGIGGEKGLDMVQALCSLQPFQIIAACGGDKKQVGRLLFHVLYQGGGGDPRAQLRLQDVVVKPELRPGLAAVVDGVQQDVKDIRERVIGWHLQQRHLIFIRRPDQIVRDRAHIVSGLDGDGRDSAGFQPLDQVVIFFLVLQPVACRNQKFSPVDGIRRIGDFHDVDPCDDCLQAGKAGNRLHPVKQLPVQNFLDCDCHKRLLTEKRRRRIPSGAIA